MQYRLQKQVPNHLPCRVYGQCVRLPLYMLKYISFFYSIAQFPWINKDLSSFMQCSAVHCTYIIYVWCMQGSIKLRILQSFDWTHHFSYLSFFNMKYSSNDGSAKWQKKIQIGNFVKLQWSRHITDLIVVLNSYYRKNLFTMMIWLNGL